MPEDMPELPTQQEIRILELLEDGRARTVLDCIVDSRGALKQTMLQLNLEDLERRGLVVGEKRSAGRQGGRPGRAYGITDIGRKLLKIAKLEEEAAAQAAARIRNRFRDAYEAVVEAMTVRRMERVAEAPARGLRARRTP